MLVKVFEAPDMPSALKLVKDSLGPDALILSTRTVRKGALGVFGGSLLEVTAAVESKPATARGRAAAPPALPTPAAPAVEPRRAAGAAAGEAPPAAGRCFPVIW
jgi:flagellar biosynthesis protein FlhF